MNHSKKYIMITAEEIKSFLEGNDPEEHIVAIEFDYQKDHIYKIKEVRKQRIGL